MQIHENAKLHHATRAKAEATAQMLEAEYPALSLEPVYNEDESQVVGFRTYHRDEVDAEPVLVLETKKVPDLATIFAACDDLDLDPEAIEAEETKASGSVVDECYRQQYREQSSTKQSCGDWLAEWLTRYLDADKKLVFDAFEQCLSNNGVDLTAKWAQVKMSSNGWQGRYRMNGRQVLEKRVALTGKLLDESGNEHEVSQDFLAAMEAKHGKWLAKQRKLEAAEAEAAKELAA